MDIKKTFVGSKMNKSLDERLVPDGEYIDALNVRISSDEDGEAGSLENAKGNEQLVALKYLGQELVNARCIGVVENDSKETLYWFVTSDTVDMIVSYNTTNSTLRYHVVSTTVLNFNAKYPVNGIDLIDNLLFFTDNYNQPRRINVDATYLQPIAGVDQVTEDDISVIVKPPIEAPGITLISSPSYNNFIEDKFIRFAYRYKYKDGEYSALSQFSDLAFSPGQFELDYTTYDMIGMRNVPNIADVTFNTGSKNVTGVDLCFKLSNSNVISVVSRFKKSDEGWPNDTDVSVTFDNQKIYTTLPDTELLRLYDNVPKKSKSQTILGSRLFYGNYVDGYDIDTVIDFDLDLTSEDLGVTDIDRTLGNGVQYNIAGATTITNSSVSLDLSGVELKEGASLYINFNIAHDSFAGDASYESGNPPLNRFDFTFQYILPRDYVSVSDLGTDTGFLSSIQLTDTVVNAAQGYSLSDSFYASIQALAPFTLSNGGITALGQGFSVSVSGDSIQLQVPAVQFEDAGVFAYEYFNVSSSTSSQFIEENARKSLHSNRDYEVGIVYLDEYNRATTALVDTNNTVHVPANVSDKNNTINVTINNVAPSWAKRFRMVMKSSKGGYETVYSNLYYFDSSQSAWWLKLEGDNQTKCKIGDTLYVKADSAGPTNKVVKCKVLDIKTQVEDFISGVESPPGVYMMIKNAGFSINNTDNETFDPGDVGTKNYDLIYDMYQNVAEPDVTPVYEEVPIPAGSQVKIYFHNFRKGSGSSCRKKKFEFDRTFIATNNYDNMYDFIVGENINFNNPTNVPSVDSSGDVPTAQFMNTILNEADIGPFLNSGFSRGWILKGLAYEAYDTKVAYYRGNDGKAWLGFQNAGGLQSCNGNNYWLNVKIQIFSANGLLVFETEPTNVNNEIFFEGNKSYAIDNRFHSGDIQNQTSVQPCKLTLDLYNCFTFGNGVESYKIDDALSLPGFTIGDRVTAVAQQDYREVHRYSDVTYSGVYNEENNVNGLNAFNLGLVNFRLLERLFGPINRMHGRQTDIMVLQEDKISYLLAGKNLLSDSVGGGTITSVPEVIGTQISRVEEYGISDDADSFVSYGYDIYFTDTKRGSVINIKGGSSQNDQLNVVSNFSMRSWFRDEFDRSHNKFKIGGYDPYSQEYVLHMSDQDRVTVPDKFECGITIEGFGDYESQVINTSTAIGDVSMSYDVEMDTTITVTYNDVVVINEVVSGTGNLTFNKNLQTVNSYKVDIKTFRGWKVGFGCVEPNELTIINIVSSDISQEGLLTNQNFFWFNGDQTSPQSTINVVPLLEDPVSLFTQEDGNESEGYFPAQLATVTMRSPDTINRSYDLTNDQMFYLLSNTLYADINEILPLSTLIQNIFINEGVVTRSFLYDNPTNLRYLYMIWRYNGVPGGGGGGGTIITANASAGFETCVGGGTNDFLGADVQTSDVVTVDTSFDIRISYVFEGQSCGQANLTSDIVLTILAGEAYASVDACSNSIIELQGGGIVCGVEILSTNNVVDNIVF